MAEKFTQLRFIEPPSGENSLVSERPTVVPVDQQPQPSIDEIPPTGDQSNEPTKPFKYDPVEKEINDAQIAAKVAAASRGGFMNFGNPVEKD